MTCQRRFDGDFCSLAVTNFTDHHDVGVGTEHGTERCGKGHAGAVIHLHLVNTGHSTFDRVFQRDNVFFERADFGKRRVKRGGFTASGRARNQHEAVGHVNCFVKPRELPFGEVDVFNRNIAFVAL